ncbi:hypothetical protein QTL95_16035 [Rhizobium sp. S152]|uniref:Integral membrane protein n=1 Tax=Halobaculum lipolyticum TaxID=3032001 RepID=A0ABD5W453_9EURY|nr:MULTISPECIES: hypothetical protein [Bacteria]MDM9627418.1 hypothetical protein [Rhizobium sp. S152]
MILLQLRILGWLGTLGIVGTVALVAVLGLGTFAFFRWREGDSRSARRRTERTSRYAAGGLVSAGLGVLAAFMGVFDVVADGLGQAVALVGTPAGGTLASLGVGAVTSYALGAAADLPVTSALVAGTLVFLVALGVSRS